MTFWPDRDSRHKIGVSFGGFWGPTLIFFKIDVGVSGEVSDPAAPKVWLIWLPRKKTLWGKL